MDERKETKRGEGCWTDAKVAVVGFCGGELGAEGAVGAVFGAGGVVAVAGFGVVGGGHGFFFVRLGWDGVGVGGRFGLVRCGVGRWSCCGLCLGLMLAVTCWR